MEKRRKNRKSEKMAYAKELAAVMEEQQLAALLPDAKGLAVCCTGGIFTPRMLLRELCRAVQSMED